MGCSIKCREWVWNPFSAFDANYAKKKMHSVNGTLDWIRCQCKLMKCFVILTCFVVHLFLLFLDTFSSQLQPDLTNWYQHLFTHTSIYSTIHEAASLTAHGCSTVSTGTILVEWKNPWSHEWENGLWGPFCMVAFWEQPVTKGPVASWIMLLLQINIIYWFQT